jgi:hypothetical protein
MTTFVDTSVLLSGHEASDQDPVVVVVRSAHGMLREGLGETDSAKFQQKFAHEYTEKNWANIFDLLLSNTNVIFKRLSLEEGNVESVARISKTAEGYFDVVLSILSKLESVEEVVERIEKFIDTIIDSEPKTIVVVQSLKLRLLKTLLSVLSPRVQLRLTVISGLCRFGTENPKFKSSVFSLVQNTAKWIEEFDWEVSNEEKFKIYSSIANVAESTDRIAYLRHQLSVCSPADKTKLSHSVEVESLNHPSFFDFDSLKSSDANIQKCVDIFANGSFKEMKEFVQKTTKIESVDMNQILEKMKVVAVQGMAASAAASHTTVITIPEIARELEVTDPFPYIVRAMQAGLLYGAINEVEGVVEIHAVKPRSSHSASAAVIEKLKKIQHALA